MLGFDFVNGELPLKIFVPHFEMEHFSKRQFMIEFNEKAFVKFSGDDLFQLQGQSVTGKNLSKELFPIMNRTIVSEND